MPKVKESSLRGILRTFLVNFFGISLSPPPSPLLLSEYTLPRLTRVSRFLRSSIERTTTRHARNCSRIFPSLFVPSSFLRPSLRPVYRGPLRPSCNTASQLRPVHAFSCENDRGLVERTSVHEFLSPTEADSEAACAVNDSEAGESSRGWIRRVAI